MSKKHYTTSLPDDGITEYSLNLLLPFDDEMNSSEVTAECILLLATLVEEGKGISMIKDKKSSTAGPMIEPLIKS